MFKALKWMWASALSKWVRSRDLAPPHMAYRGGSQWLGAWTKIERQRRGLLSPPRARV
jgi:hypothetical protein